MVHRRCVAALGWGRCGHIEGWCPGDACWHGSESAAGHHGGELFWYQHHDGGLSLSTPLRLPPPLPPPQGSVPAADQREWAAALLRALPQTDKADAVAAVLAAVAELHDAQLAEQCLAVLSTAHSQRQRFGGRQSAAAAACITAEHAPALARLCRLCGWSAPCLSAVEVLLKRLATGGVCSLPSCIALLQELHAAATAPEGIAHATAAVASVAAPAAVPDPAEAAAPQAAAAAAPAAAAGAAAGGAAPATALSQPAGGDSCGQAAVAALLKSSLVHLSSRLAVVQRADSGGYERARQAEAAAGMVQLLSLVQEWSDEAAIEKFLLTGFARHFIAAGPAADGSGGDCVEGQGPMLAVLLAACQRFGWGSSRTAAILTAAASGCAPSTGGYGDFLELAKGVQAAAGHAAAALVPQLTAAFLKALPPAQPSVYAYPETTELDLRAQVRAAAQLTGGQGGACALEACARVMNMLESWLDGRLD